MFTPTWLDDTEVSVAVVPAHADASAWKPSMSPGTDFYFDTPERIRQLSDEEFERFWKSAVAAHHFLFLPGRFSKDGPRYVEDNVVDWRVQLEDQSRGNVMLIPKMPRSFLDWAAVLTEEFIIRQCRWIAAGILADMCLQRSAYAQLWESIGEYEVWQSQLACVCIQEHFRTQPLNGNNEKLSRSVSAAIRTSSLHDLPAPPNREEVLAFRKDFMGRIATGVITPLRPGDIIERGLMLFDNRRECTDSDAVNDMLARFGSKLRFGSSETMREDKPYAFMLGYSVTTSWLHIEPGECDDPEHLIGAEFIGFTLACSPAFNPRWEGWTPS